MHEADGRQTAGDPRGGRAAIGRRTVDELPAYVLHDLRRLVRSAALELGTAWPDSQRVGGAIEGVPAGVCIGLIEAVRAGAARVDGSRFSVDPPTGPSRWFPLFVRTLRGGPRLSLRRALQIHEYHRVASIARQRDWRVDAVTGAFDVVAVGEDRRWCIAVVDRPSRVGALVREVTRQGLAIDLDGPASTSGPLHLARSLHLGGATHFSVVAPGHRRDHSVHHGDRCVVLTADIAPC